MDRVRNNSLYSALFILFVFAISFGFSQILPKTNTLTEAGQWTAFIFFSAVILWFTEVIPPFATAIVVVGLNILILGNPNGVFAETSKDWKMFVMPITSDIIFIFFGGFVLAIMAQKYKLDHTFSKIVLSKAKGKPALLLLILMITTATFSMFMSNTATAAMMFAMMSKMILDLPESENRFKTGLALSIPFAANIGGMGTLIGSPPNGIAQANLKSLETPIDVTFLDWMVIGIPIVIILLIVLWATLYFMYKPNADKVEMNFHETPALDIPNNIWIVYLVFATTITLWLTGKYTGIPTSVAALFPIVVFTGLKIFNVDDLKKIDWNIIILVAGGLSLGVSIQKTGFGDYFVSLLPLQNLPGIGIILILLAMIIILSNFMSNSAASAMIIPMILAVPGNTAENVICVALGASLAMSLPISTPPNAIAYGSGLLKTKDFILVGSWISFIGVIIILLMSRMGAWTQTPTFIFR